MVFFLVGDYRNHSLINDFFRDDFGIIAERIGIDAAIIAQNNTFEDDLQNTLKSVEEGSLGRVLSSLEERMPGLLILNKHPNDLYHFNEFMKKARENMPDNLDYRQQQEYMTELYNNNMGKHHKLQKDDIIIYIPFEILEMVYTSTNTLMSDIVAFSKKQNNDLLRKTSKFSYVRDKENKLDIGSINFEIKEDNKTNNVEGNRHKEVIEVVKDLLDRRFNQMFDKIEGWKYMEKALIITALAKELEPILDAIDSPLKPRNWKVVNGRSYFIYEVSPALTVICTSFLGMGQLNASIAVKEAVEYFDVNKVILAGICGGIDGEMKYGDIIISDQIVDYELAKIKEDDTYVRWNVYRSDFELMQNMMAFKSDRWFSHIKRTFPDIECEEPKAYAGIVLSGNKVIANYEEIKRFKKTWSKALAVEMEASGIAATLHQMNNAPSFIMVKAICDFANSEKNDDWQEYAACVSAAFVLNFIFSECNFQPRIVGSNRVAGAIQSGVADRYQKLLSAIRGTYNLSEINVLAFNIGVDIEEIGGVSKSEKIIELIKYCKRRNVLDKLIDQINTERNNLLIDYEKSNEL